MPKAAVGMWKCSSKGWMEVADGTVVVRNDLVRVEGVQCGGFDVCGTVVVALRLVVKCSYD